MINKNETPKETIKRLISLPANEQMILREELIKTLERYLKTCKTPDDLNYLNGGSNGKGLWFGDTRILSLISAYGGEIYKNLKGD